MMNKLQLKDFVRESNKIEGILRDPKPIEIDAHRIFFNLPVVTVEDLKLFVSVCQPNAILRDELGLDVRVGNHRPPSGDSYMPKRVAYLLNDMDYMTPYRGHIAYEIMHPFTDCNGRSGRALWAWHMNRAGFNTELGFLHTFYYQALAENIK